MVGLEEWMDGKQRSQYKYCLVLLVSMKAHLGFSMPLFLPRFFCCFVYPTKTVGLSSRPLPSLARFTTIFILQLVIYVTLNHILAG